MDGSDFTQLLDLYGALVRWERSFPCPCTLSTGAADRTCPLCVGRGRYYDPPGDPFEVALLNQSSRDRMAMAQMLGPGAMGDGVLVVFEGAPCYEDIDGGDRIWDTARVERTRLVLHPAIPLRLPVGASNIAAFIPSEDRHSLVEVPPPVPDAAGRVQVDETTRLEFLAPRGYEVVLDLSKIRTFGRGLPKRLPIRRIDLTVR